MQVGRGVRRWDLQRRPHFIRQMYLRVRTTLHRQGDPWDLAGWVPRPMYPQYHPKFPSTRRFHELLIQPTVLSLRHPQSLHQILRGRHQTAHAQETQDIRNTATHLVSVRLEGVSMRTRTGL